MESWRCWANWAAWSVGAAIIVRRWLAPWSYWLGRLALCWGRYALSYGRYPSDREPRGPRHSACPCCGGVDFDGMAGRWAVVTGCTDGIGKEYALQLADLRMNVVLVGRNANKLRNVDKTIHDRHGRSVQTRVIVVDFTSGGGGAVTLTEKFDAVRRGLAGLDVAVLVNNAGVANPRPDRLLDMTAVTKLGDPCHDIIECNALAAVAMCRVAMPLMLEGGHRCQMLFDSYMDNDDDEHALLLSTTLDPLPLSPNTSGGVVINIGSISAHIPLPLFTVYTATKSFLEKFSIELATEYDRDGPACSRVAVRCLTPGLVATKMSRMKPSSDMGGMTMLPGPRTYARHSLRSLECHCACRLVRRKERRDRANGTARSEGSLISSDYDRAGLLANVLSTVFDSPSSPFSTGHTGVTTTGYLPHTIMVIMVNAALWIAGYAYVSNAVQWFLNRNRKRMLRRDAEKAADKEAAMAAAAAADDDDDAANR